MCLGSTAAEGSKSSNVGCKSDGLEKNASAARKELRVKEAPLNRRRARKDHVALRCVLGGLCLGAVVVGARRWTEQRGTFQRNEMELPVEPGNDESVRSPQAPRCAGEGRGGMTGRNQGLGDRLRSVFRRRRGGECGAGEVDEAIRPMAKGGGSKGGLSLGRKKSKKGMVDSKYKKEVIAYLQKELAAHPNDLLGRARATGHALDEQTLSRFLEMAYWSLEAGGKPLTHSIESTIAWREEYGAHMIAPSQVEKEAAHGKLFARGYDREGRPVIYFNPGEERSFNAEQGLRLLIYTLERAVSMLPKHLTQFAVIVNLAGFGPSTMPPVAMIKEALRTLQQHYPMRLGYVRIVNAGGPINFIWKLISSVLDERTKRKISFVPGKEAASTLAYHVDPAVLQSSLPGGLDPFVYSNEEYLR
ncbi:unnamed protein product [Discosporangium mesarthrocarpum]